MPERLRVVIVDEQLANKFWPGQDPIGRFMYFPGDIKTIMAPPPRDEWMTVIGVVENVRLDGLVDGAKFRTVGAFYLPLEQSLARNLGLAVRTGQEPTAMTNVIRRELAAIDPELDRYMHLAALNRGVLMTPFHNMALIAPSTTEADIDRHTNVFRESVAALLR